jgi:hypothetical protein
MNAPRDNRRSWSGWIALQAIFFSVLISAGNVFPARSISCADDLFVDGSVPELEIRLADQEVRSLREHPRQDVEALIRIRGSEFRGAKVHLKGSGTFQPIDRKPSFTLNIEGLSGIWKIHLNNSAEDATFVQEKLGSELFAAAGIPAPHVGHARVKLNGRDKGLYVLKEGFSREFLARTFSEELGKVYDKNSRHFKARTMNLQPERLNEVVDIDQFASFLAMEVLLCHWDGYALANNNFRAYQNSTTGRFIFLPVGMDQLFGNPQFPLAPDMTGPLARVLMESSERKGCFAIRLAELASEFDGARAAQRARDIAFSLRPAVSFSEFGEIREAMEDLSARILARGNYLRHQAQSFTAMNH